MKSVEENYFRYKALIETFAEKYQPCQNILFRTTPQISSDPDFYQIMKKLDYKNWELNSIENFLIFPLQN